MYGELEVNQHGLMRRSRAAEVQGMLAPVQCGSCGKIYDSANVKVTARYADCSVWESPCCGKTADDRQYVGFVSAIALDRNGNRRSR